MYSDKPHINSLTKALLHLGITDIVVCPGARNAPLCHNFHQAGFALHPVTDERSAAFVSIGIYLETRRPTVVCVTSGTALLNTLPAVAEAYYRHIPLLIISADRPEEWIGHLDGQTLPQRNALLPYAACVNIEEHTTLKTIIRQIKRSLQEQAPTHINIHIEEPLFQFTQPSLPDIDEAVEQVDSEEHSIDEAQLNEIAQLINKAQFPLLVMGQQEDFEPDLFEALSTRMAILPEIISNAKDSLLSDKVEKCLSEGASLSIFPDLILHIGGAFIGKQLKLFLRQQTHIPIIRIGKEKEVAKTFGRVTLSVHASPLQCLQKLLPFLTHRELHKLWSNSINDAYNSLRTKDISKEEKAIIEYYNSLKLLPLGSLHLANSSSVRWANAHIEGGHFPVYCNRGVNGIEGSLSTAVGQALKSEMIVGYITGDLSFFYDANALWNTRLRENLIILLLNNSGGKIFYKFGALKDSLALKDYISAHHTTSAEGICASYDAHYKRVTHPEQIAHFISEHLNSERKRPLVMEYICD